MEFTERKGVVRHAVWMLLCLLAFSAVPAYCCDMVAAVGPSFIDDGTTEGTARHNQYESTMGNLVSLANATWGMNPHKDPTSWAVEWYGWRWTSPYKVRKEYYLKNQYRSNRAIYLTTPPPNETTTYYQKLDDAVADYATLVMAHARASSTLSSLDDPHPFVYPDLIGNTYSFMHNGGITAGMPAVEDNLGAQFIATELFQNRALTSWSRDATHNPLRTRLDSEYYFMMFMKYLLIARNYYWPSDWTASGITTPMEFAGNQAVNQIIGLTGVNYSALNCFASDGVDLWAFYRRLNVDSYNKDWQIAYFNDPVNMPSAHFLTTGGTTLNLPATWTNWNDVESATNHGHYVRLQPNVTPVPETFLTTVLSNPTELRINGEPNSVSTGDQVQPSISANPVDGSFVTVWKTYDRTIMGRWYNQVGLAERKEFNVYPDPSPDGASTVAPPKCDMPVVAHSTDGTSMLVVWKSAASTNTSTYTLIKARPFTWDLATRTWTAGTVFTVNTSTAEAVDHPSVAWGDGNEYVITWQRNVTTPTAYKELRFYYYSPGLTITDRQIGNGGVSGGSDSEPDVAYQGLIGGEHVWAIAYQTQSTATHGVGVIMFKPTNRQFASPVLVATTNNGETSHPAIAKITPTQFVVAFYQDQTSVVAANTYSTNFSSITLGTAYTGASLWDQIYPDVAVRGGASGIFDVVYHTFNENTDWYYDIFLATRPTTGTTLITSTSPVNTYQITSDQSMPAIVTSQQYGANDAMYRNGSDLDIYNQRRMIVWQTYNQDGGGWGIAGNIKGVSEVGSYTIFQTDNYTPPTNLLDEFVGGDTPTETPSGECPNLISEINSLPQAFALNSAYPNPFNPTTTVPYDLPQAANVRIDIFDINGRLVNTLVDAYQSAGRYAVNFDGSQLSSGVYFARMQAGTFSTSRKLILMK